MSHLVCSSVSDLWKERVLAHHVFIADERREEAMSKALKGGITFYRALHGFVLLRGEEPDFVQPFAIESGYWKGVTVMGYAAELQGQEGLFVQSGHWFHDLVKFHLVQIDDVTSLELGSHPTFRNGEACMWLSAGNYKYAMMSPFSFFESLWQLTLDGYLASPCGMPPLSNGRPAWLAGQAQTVWVRLQYQARIDSMPAIRRKLASNDAWHYPREPPQSSSRPMVCPVSIDCNALPGQNGTKRAIDDSHLPGATSSQQPPEDGERRRKARRYAIEDPNRLHLVMRTALDLEAGIQDRSHPIESTMTRQKIPCCMDHVYVSVWGLGAPIRLGSTEGKGDKGEKSGKGGKKQIAASSRTQTGRRTGK
ncbi:hypothetical protein FRC08_014447 [Ceratobasidium sp. 394]|nr:hypothetical protein FRC08_014447 [Ceratobasidium sp. 394]KAG9100031.1 hypothetical protein FS749_016450 [Ceratobasidium sp. UAMH 11750]